MNAKAEQKERSHATILESAGRLLREKGIAGARVADVMKGAGLTVGGFYAHFASKEALVDDVIRRTLAEMRSRLFREIDERPLDERADLVVERYLSLQHRDMGAEGCPLPSVIGEIATSAPEHTPVLAEQLAISVSELEKHVRPRPGLTRRQVAIALIALMYGGLTLARALRGTSLSDDVVRACRAFAKSGAPR